MGPVARKSSREFPRKKSDQGSTLVTTMKKRKRKIRGSRDINFINDWQVSICEPSDLSERERKHTKKVERTPFHIELEEDYETPAGQNNKESASYDCRKKNLEKRAVAVSTPAEKSFTNEDMRDLLKRNQISTGSLRSVQKSRFTFNNERSPESFAFNKNDGNLTVDLKPSSGPEQEPSENTSTVGIEPSISYSNGSSQDNRTALKDTKNEDEIATDLLLPNTNKSQIDESGNISGVAYMSQEDSSLFTRSLRKAQEPAKRFTFNYEKTSQKSFTSSSAASIDNKSSVSSHSANVTQDDYHLLKTSRSARKHLKRFTINYRKSQKNVAFVESAIAENCDDPTADSKSSSDFGQKQIESVGKIEDIVNTVGENKLQIPEVTSSIIEVVENGSDETSKNECVFVVDDCKKKVLMEAEKENVTGRRSTYEVDFNKSLFATHLREVDTNLATPARNLTPAKRVELSTKRRKSHFSTPVLSKKPQVTEFNDSSIVFQESVLRTSSPLSCKKDRKNSTYELDETVNSPIVLKDNEVGLSSTKTKNDLVQECDELPITKNSSHVTLRDKNVVKSSGKSQSVVFLEDTEPPVDLNNLMSDDTLPSQSLIEFEENEKRVRRRSYSLSMMTPGKKRPRKSSLNSPRSVKEAKGANLYKKILNKNLASAQSNVPVRTKMPNFAEIHQKAAEKMEDIAEYQKRKAERAKLLMSGGKPKVTPTAPVLQPPKCTPATNNRCRNLFNIAHENRSSTRSQISKTPSTKIAQIVRTKTPCKPFQFGASNGKLTPVKNVKLKSEEAQKRKELVKAVATKTRVKKPETKQKEFVKGIRTNRRFELLMKMRQT